MKQSRMLALMLLCGLAFTSACTTYSRVVYVEETDPVRLRERVKGVKVWTFDKDGNLVPGLADLPEGLWILKDPGEKNDG